VADPVEELFFEVDAIPMTNFVYPAYFEAFHKKGSTRFDHMGALDRPFDLHSKAATRATLSTGKRKQSGVRKPRRRALRRKTGEGHRSSFRHKKKRKKSTAQ
jgi:hypothetical protein